MTIDYDKDIWADDGSQQYDDKRQEFINAAIKQERKNSPDKVTDKEIELICKRNDTGSRAEEICECINRHASVEQLAVIMEKYTPVMPMGGVWATYYANAADAKEDDCVADKIIKAVELWGKKDFYRYDEVIDFYTAIIEPKKLTKIVEEAFAPEHRRAWFDRPEQVALMLKSANHLLTECAKEESLYNYNNCHDFMKATDRLLDAVYYDGVSTSATLAKATEELLQTKNQIKRENLEREITESMEVFRENFPNYKPIRGEKTPKDSIAR